MTEKYPVDRGYLVDRGVPGRRREYLVEGRSTWQKVGVPGKLRVHLEDGNKWREYLVDGDVPGRRKEYTVVEGKSTR